VFRELPRDDYLKFVKDAGEAGAASDLSGLISFYADDADFNLKRSDYLNKWTHFLINFNKDSNFTILYVNGNKIGDHKHKDYYKSVINQVNTSMSAKGNCNGGFMSNLRIVRDSAGDWLISTDNVKRLYDKEREKLLI